MFDGLDCGDEDEGSSGSAEEGQDWRAENATNGTELCSGVMEVHSSQLIYSASDGKNDSSGNASHCESVLGA